MAKRCHWQMLNAHYQVLPRKQQGKGKT